jgi:hypothetical protein
MLWFRNYEKSISFKLTKKISYHNHQDCISQVNAFEYKNQIWIGFSNLKNKLILKEKNVLRIRN